MDIRAVLKGLADELEGKKKKKAKKIKVEED